MGMIILDTVRNSTSYYWGERTSTIDWCEENYAVSNYIAEFWNCLTNGIFIALALMGMYTTIKHKQGKRMFACYGPRSCFHATLKYTTQMLDELPMLYLCAFVFYALVEADKKPAYGVLFPSVLFAFQAGITLTYLFWVQSPVFHQVAFGLTSVACVVGTPLDTLLQLHGWWHILTAYGSTYLLLWVHFIRLARLGHDHLFTVRYRLGFLPYVALKNPKKID
ncbi:ceramidase-domain-containing protein [Kickxella alabastrina]|uniref:ceramidase-domain-containing protein n=1 Tax=Kickxella alabastrina TaxID=61397 RepID=UPI00221F8EBF|nr:ceramidase-domain-containing protein [Kickxella alabastrina]KAI7823153.1 ceramidase-domain-containing protein [Kickxella alabastrina]